MISNYQRKYANTQVIKLDDDQAATLINILVREASFRGHQEASTINRKFQEELVQHIFAEAMTVKDLAKLCKKKLGSNIFDYETFEDTLYFIQVKDQYNKSLERMYYSNPHDLISTTTIFVNEEKAEPSFFEDYPMLYYLGIGIVVTFVVAAIATIIISAIATGGAAAVVPAIFAAAAWIVGGTTSTAGMVFGFLILTGAAVVTVSTVVYAINKIVDF